MDSTSHNKPTSHPLKHHHQTSSSELLSSAKLVAEAARATFSNESDKVDKAKVAGAAEDLVAAASKYGNLEDKSFGKYVEQAENYLHKYHSSGHSTTTTTHSGDSTTTNSHSSSLSSGGHGNSGSGSGTATNTHSSSHSSDGDGDGDGDGKSGGGYGEYFKMAEGFLKKR